MSLCHRIGRRVFWWSVVVCCCGVLRCVLWCCAVVECCGGGLWGCVVLWCVLWCCGVVLCVVVWNISRMGGPIRCSQGRLTPLACVYRDAPYCGWQRRRAMGKLLFDPCRNPNHHTWFLLTIRSPPLSRTPAAPPFPAAPSPPRLRFTSTVVLSLYSSQPAPPFSCPQSR